MRNRATLGLITAFVIGTLGALPTSLAEPSPADRALATQLFKEGRALLEQGKTSEACRKLEESQRLDPGGGTLLNLAICHESEGRVATAWSEFTEALGIAKRDGREDRRKLAETHIAALEKELPYLVVVVSKEADDPELQVKRDGSSVGRAAWGSLMPVDPGEHMIEALAPGKQPFQTKVSVPRGAGTTSITIPRLPDVEPVGVSDAQPLPGATARTQQGPVAESGARSPSETLGPTPAPPARPSGSPTSGRSVAGWVLTGIGVGGIAVGSYFGLRAISDQSKSDDHCSGGCDQDGARLSHDAATKADYSTVGFAVGIVGLASGIYLLASGTSERPTSTPRSWPSQASWSARIRPFGGLESAGLAVTGGW